MIIMIILDRRILRVLFVCLFEARIKLRNDFFFFFFFMPFHFQVFFYLAVDEASNFGFACKNQNRE